MSSAMPAMHAFREWDILEPQPLSARSWASLLRNEIPAIVLRQFATPQECAQLLVSANHFGFGTYCNVVPQIDRIGVTVFEHDRSAHLAYFREADAARKVQRAIFAGAFDPVNRFLQLLRSRAGVTASVASDPQLGTYYAGLVRRIERGTLLHIDYAPAEHPSWSIARVQSQFSWNVYIEIDASAPGETRIFNRQWRPSDEALRMHGTYGYRPEIVTGAQHVCLRPALGEVYILNTRNYHQVEASGGHRTTVGSAGGEMGGAIVLWS
jgi:hypothetical protein